MSEPILALDADRFAEVVLGAPGPVVVDWYSTECPPCEALAAKYEGLAAIYGDDITFVKIFRQGNRELATSLGITGSPTVMFYQAGSLVGDRLTGGIKRADLERNLQALLSPERVAELAARKQPVTTDVDVLILGAGPAGLTAGIYLAQARYRTLIVDRALAGGNVGTTHQVSNFPGFIAPQSGAMLAHTMGEQAKAAGVEYRLATDVTAVDVAGRTVILDGVETVRARKVILATGSSPRPLGVQGELEYKGRGVSYCATCDAKYYQDQHVVVIGGGNSAIEEALFIAKFAARITIVHQFASLQANAQAQEQAFAEPKISFLFEHEPRAFLSNGTTVDRVVAEDLRLGAMVEIGCDGVFVFAGMQPNLDLVPGVFELDPFGYVATDAMLHTSRPDWFAAGDVAAKRFRQITTAVSDGTIAAMAIAQELATQAPAPALA